MPNKQLQFDVKDAELKKCTNCGVGEYFDQVIKLGVVSRLAPNNRTGIDQLIKFETFLCRACGVEYGNKS